MRLGFLSVILASLAVAFILIAAPARAAFNPLGNVCNPNNPNTKNTPACQQNTQQNGSGKNPVVDVIKTATNIIALIAGIGAMIMIIISGVMFVTAGGATPGQRSGDPNRIKNARATLTNSIIGMIIIGLAWTIVTFVTDKLVKT